MCFSQDESKQKAEGSEGCSEMDDEDNVIAERSWAAVMIAAELLVASLSSCNNEISGDCISGYNFCSFFDRTFVYKIGRNNEKNYCNIDNSIVNPIKNN